jgi:hypothetical protein
MEKGQNTDLGRRKFLGAAAAAILAGAMVQITGCSTEEEGPTDKTGVVVGNHGHSAKVTRVQLDAGGGVTLDIQGSAGHNHTLALTAAQVQAIAAGTHIMLDSSSATQPSEHSHNVMFN